MDVKNIHGGEYNLSATNNSPLLRTHMQPDSPGMGDQSENANYTAGSDASTSVPGDDYRELEFILYSRVIVIIAIIGVLGNILNLAVLSRKKMSRGMQSLERSANIGLLALSFSDLMACICQIPSAHIDVTEQFFTNVFDAYFSAHAHAVTNIFVLSSTWLIVSMATSRYVAICHPMSAVKVIRTSTTRIVTGVVVVFCFLLVLPQFWENKVTKYEHTTGTYYFKLDGYFRSHRTAHMVYICVYFVIGLVVPFLVLVFCNVSLVRSLHRSFSEVPNAPSNMSQRNSGTSRLTLTLVIIVVMYIVLDIPAEFIRFLDQVAQSQQRSSNYNLAVALLNTLQVLNFAFNFILYCAISPHFRKCLKDWVQNILVCMKIQSKKPVRDFECTTKYTMDTKEETVALRRTECCT